MELQEPPIYIDRARQDLPARLRRHPHARCSTRSRGWRSTRTSPLPTSRACCWSSRARSSAPSARSGCGRTTSRSPSPAWRSTCRASAATATGWLADGSRCSLCKGSGWIEILGSGMVDPNVLGFVAGQRLRPGEGAGLRVRHGHRADRDAQARRARPAPVLRERRALPGAVRLMRVPLAWLRSYCDPGLSAEDIAERLDLTGTELERIERIGVPSDEGFVVGKVAGRREASRRRPADGVRGGRRLRPGADHRLRRAQRGRRPDRGGGAAGRDDARRHRARRGQAARA